MRTLGHDTSIRLLSLVCLLAPACGDKGGTSTDTSGATDTDTTGPVVTGDSSGAVGTETSTSVTTGTADSTGATTGAPDTGSTTEAEPPDSCASSCASEETCYVDEEPSTGVGGDDCDEGSHCVVRMDCACILSFCEADCDPADPATCEPGTTCDANSGLCF